MVRIIVSIEGMACEHCEAAVNEAIGKNFAVDKVKSSHVKKEAEIIAAADIDAGELERVIKSIGFVVTGVQSKPYEKKSFALFK